MFSHLAGIMVKNTSWLSSQTLINPMGVNARGVASASLLSSSNEVHRLASVECQRSLNQSGISSTCTLTSGGLVGLKSAGYLLHTCGIASGMRLWVHASELCWTAWATQPLSLPSLIHLCLAACLRNFSTFFLVRSCAVD